MTAFGYGSPVYGKSFQEFGEVITLPRSRIQVIKRSIDESNIDLVGLYPFTVCDDWSRVDEEIAYIRKMGAVSIVLVMGPFAGQAAKECLSHWTVCAHFKTQFIVNLREDWRALRGKNVRRRANQGLRLQALEVVENPGEYAETFWELYQHTIERHAVSGIQRLSLAAIRSQLEVEGVLMVIARRGKAVCGAMISYHQGELGYLHLVGQTTEGLENKTSYALIHRSLEVLESRGCGQVNLGGPSGISDDPTDGLYRFKSRWTRHRKESLLCGEILDPDAYDLLVDRSRCQPGSFFPAYRTPGGRFEWRPGSSLAAAQRAPQNPPI